MSDALKLLSFSLDRDLLKFTLDEQIIEINRGLHYIESQSIRANVLNHLAIENMIEVIEEILESTTISYQPQKIAITSDQRLNHLSELFFPRMQIINRVLLEDAFNDFIKQIKYYAQQVSEEHSDIFSYFVFIREMVHHLNIYTIQYIED